MHRYKERTELKPERIRNDQFCVKVFRVKCLLEEHLDSEGELYIILSRDKNLNENIFWSCVWQWKCHGFLSCAQDDQHIMIQLTVSFSTKQQIKMLKCSVMGWIIEAAHRGCMVTNRRVRAMSTHWELTHLVPYKALLIQNLRVQHISSKTYIV